eukprot:CAMPEP_0183339140 /NCGR_PEP_ID=MMETSP0164_2-20130417/6174_1 /TAXON_ID=221442 /ORGANISM="Coccolithus pelagicus ssp braarudi, Strain PLY182g" /LENGTH=169 /DNA_ID=CAMNT_0025509095 /DNA_START=133 /DNA_END=640 /DNA_ORIENTATION=-
MANVTRRSQPEMQVLTRSVQTTANRHAIGARARVCFVQGSKYSLLAPVPATVAGAAPEGQSRTPKREHMQAWWHSDHAAQLAAPSLPAATTAAEAGARVQLCRCCSLHVSVKSEDECLKLVGVFDVLQRVKTLSVGAKEHDLVEVEAPVQSLVAATGTACCRHGRGEHL